MEPVSIAGIVVSAVAAASAYASQRAASKAAIRNQDSVSRVDMEKDAYTRARAIDVDTINRQERELKELRENEVALEIRVREAEDLLRQANAEKEALKAEVRALRKRVARLERGIPLESEEDIHERADDNIEPGSE